MAVIPNVDRETFDIVESEKPELGFKFRDVLYIVVASILLLVLVAPDNVIRTSPIPLLVCIPYSEICMHVKIIIAALLLLLYLMRSVVRLYEYERAVVFRFGKFKKVAGPGWVLIFPLFERYKKVDLRLQVFNIPPQEVVTRDKVRFLVSAEVFMYVTDPKKAVINVEDYKKAVLTYIESSLTHDCGSSTSDYIITHMDDLTRSIEERIEHIANTPGKEWGIKVVKVKLTFVRFPDKVQDAMHEKVAAEQLKLAAHERAEAMKIEIDAIREAGSKLTDPALTYMYLETLDKIARGRATKIVLPVEITKVAETISKRTGQLIGPEGLPVEMINKYKEMLENYERRLKEIESKVKGAKVYESPELPPIEEEKEEKKEEEKVEKPSKIKVEENEKEIEKRLEKKIRDIKKKLGIT